MELKGIKNIIFDLGGVLLNLDFQLTEQAFFDLGIKDFRHYFSKAQQVGLFNSFETGKISENEFCSELKELTKITATDIQVVHAWNAMLLDFPEKRKQLLLNLKENFNTSLLSNTNETHVHAFNQIIKKDIDESSLAPLFNSIYYSNEIGQRKPSQEAFQMVLEENNYLPSETLFLDDSIQHVEGAKKCGIHTVHVKEQRVEELFSNFLT